MPSQTVMAVAAIAVIVPIASIILWSMDAPTHDGAQEPGLAIVASFYPLYEFASEVAGDMADVSLLVPRGVEPHDWEPSIREIQRVQDADMVVINGAGFEGWLDRIDTAGSGVEIIDSSRGVQYIIHESGAADPHVWLSPVLAQKQVQNIADSLKRIDPENTAYYQANADGLVQRLISLDDEIRETLSGCRTDFVAFHDAFSYFAAEYGLVQHNIVGQGPHGEPTSGDLERLITLAREKDIRVIFTEEAVDARTSGVIADEIGGSVMTLSTLEIAEAGSSYVDRMERNLDSLEAALCR